MMIVTVIFFILSVILYFISPSIYSQQYNIILLIVFLLSSFNYILYTFDSNYFNFHIIFIISFFFVNFVYPVFLYPQNPLYFPVYKLRFNHDIITKATSLALLGINSYFFGGIIVKKEKISLIPRFHMYSIKSIKYFLTLISLVFFLSVLLDSWDGIILGKFGSTGIKNQFLLALFQISFELAIIFEVLSKKDLYKGSIIKFIVSLDKILMTIGILFVFLYFRVGDRGPIIQLFLVIFTLFTIYVKRLSFKAFIIIVFFGMFTLTLVSYARTKDENLLKKENSFSDYVDRGLKKMNFTSFFDVGMDLIVNNRNLYFGMDYADKNGYNYGKNMFHYLFAPFPKIPMIMTSLFFDSTPTQLSTGYIITIETLGPKATYGLGTNIIVDVYMAFGSLGVILFMFFLGYFVRYLQVKSMSSKSVFFFILYLIMISFSVYCPRAPFFEPFRFLAWSFIFVLFIRYFVKVLIWQQQISKA